MTGVQTCALPIWETTLTTLQPGYRSDALVVFPEVGDYCVIDTSAPAPGSVSQALESRQLLGVVKADVGTTVSGDIHSYLTEQLVAAEIGRASCRERV